MFPTQPPVRTSRLVSACALAAALGVAGLPTLASGKSSTSAEASEAAPSASAPTQRSKMKTCNAEAKGKHGDERKSFMKQCLSKKGAASQAS